MVNHQLSIKNSGVSKMDFFKIALPIIFLLLLGCSSSIEAKQDRIASLDAYWAEVSRCVKEGDFQGYSSTIHPEGVLVAGTGKKAYPLTKALSNWEKNFTATKAGETTEGVSFKFSERLGDETTAHETGMFLYWKAHADGKKKIEYIHLAALLVMKNGEWKILMEHQKSKGTKEEWDAL
jgi:hypothetical protein